MRPFARFCLPVLCSFLLTGCVAPDIPNPFASTSDVSDVYLSQFPDIPIPADMKSNSKNTLVSTTPDGIKIGLETFTGRVQAPSLANAMIHNMSRQGWSLRGSVTGNRTMQLHEKEERFAVIYLYESALNTTMEVWIVNRLPGGLFGGGQSLFPSIASPADTTVEQWEGTGSSPLER
jgi:hypothetical protein